MPAASAHRRLRREEGEFDDSLGYTARQLAQNKNKLNKNEVTERKRTEEQVSKQGRVWKSLENH